MAVDHPAQSWLFIAIWPNRINWQKCHQSKYHTTDPVSDAVEQLTRDKSGVLTGCGCALARINPVGEFPRGPAPTARIASGLGSARWSSDDRWVTWGNLAARGPDNWI